MRYAILALLLLGGCTMTHRVVLVYEGPDQNVEWQAAITQRLNDLMACAPLTQVQCVDLLEATRKEGP